MNAVSLVMEHREAWLSRDGKKRLFEGRIDVWRPTDWRESFSENLSNVIEPFVKWNTGFIKYKRTYKNWVF